MASGQTPFADATSENGSNVDGKSRSSIDKNALGTFSDAGPNSTDGPLLVLGDCAVAAEVDQSLTNTESTLPWSQYTISTPRLRLRAARAEDLQHLHRMLSSPICMQYWSTPPHKDLEQTQKWLDGMIASRWNGVRDFFIELRDRVSGENGDNDGFVIGKAGLWDGSEVGVMISQDHWRKGYAREALEAILSAAKNERWTDHVTADVDPRNNSCLALLGGLGFVEVGRRERTYEVADGWADSVDLVFSIDQ